MKRSRLSRKIEKQTKRGILLGLLGIIIVLVMLMKFGIPLLVKFSLLISESTAPKQQQLPNETVFIAPPILNPLPNNATNSANVILSGLSSPEANIEVFINSNSFGKTKTTKNGDFSFEIALKPGKNVIKAVVNSKDNKQSGFSTPITIVYRNAPPSLNIVSPSDGQSFSKDQDTIQVSGSTDFDVKVTVNDFWAILDENGNFSYNLILKPGDNQIKVVATDQAGNKKEKEIKVTYSP